MRPQLGVRLNNQTSLTVPVELAQVTEPCHAFTPQVLRVRLLQENVQEALHRGVLRKQPAPGDSPPVAVHAKLDVHGPPAAEAKVADGPAELQILNHHNLNFH